MQKRFCSLDPIFVLLRMQISRALFLECVLLHPVLSQLDQFGVYFFISDAGNIKSEVFRKVDFPQDLAVPLTKGFSIQADLTSSTESRLLV